MSRITGIVTVTAQAEGAWPNGAQVRKINSEPGDRSPDGTVGQIVGSLDVRDQGREANFCYFITWTDFPLPILVADHTRGGLPRLELIEE